MSLRRHPRPNVAMSQEEHASLQEVKAEVRGLGDTLKSFIIASEKRHNSSEARVDKMVESRQLSLGNIAVFIGLALSLAGAVSTLNTMTIKTTIATDVAPILAQLTTQNTVSINDRASLHDDLSHFVARIDVGKDARLAHEKDEAVEMAVRKEREGEMYHKLFGHFPR